MTPLHLRRSPGTAPGPDLRAGHDLVVSPDLPISGGLAHGVLADDLLAGPQRPSVDEAARRTYAAWRKRASAALTLDGLDLADALEVELLAACFLPQATLRQSEAALRELVGGREVCAQDVPGAAAELVALLIGGSVGAGAPVRPRPQATPSLRRLCGVPGRVAGDVVGMSYWHLGPVYERLADPRAGLRLTAAPLYTGHVRRRAGVVNAIRGGWLGAPGERARRAARRDLARAVREAAALAPADPIERAVHHWALAVVASHGAGALAGFRHARRALSRGTARTLVLPWDSPDVARVLMAAGAEAGLDAVVVQHGFDARLGNPDKTRADRIAVWSTRDRDELPDSARGLPVVTGNPGAAHLAGARPVRSPRARSPRAVVLCEYPSRLSAAVDLRIGAEHLEAAVRGLADAGGFDVVLRPHPFDSERREYAEQAERAGLRMTIDGTSDIETLLGDADVCVAGLSTATLQAAVLGTPAIVLDVSGAPRPWPFDGSPGALPRATDAAELAQELRAALESRDVAGAGAAREALGVRPDAVARVLEVIADAVAAAPGRSR